MKKVINFIVLAIITFPFLAIAQNDFSIFEKQAEDSDLAIIGQVIEKEGYWNDDRTKVFTSNKIQVLGNIKGESPSVIEIITYGGEVDSTYQYWSEEKTLSLNQTAYLFLREDKSGFAKPESYYTLIEQGSVVPLPKKETPDITANNFVTDKIIEFGFDNIQIQQINQLSFDILVKTNAAGVGLKFGYGDILAEYSDNVFGLNVYANDKLGVSKQVVISDAAYFPNPFSNEINIDLSLDSPSEVQIKIYDLLGKNILTSNREFMNSGEHSLTITDIPTVTSGIYFLEVNLGSNSKVTKLIKL